MVEWAMPPCGLVVVIVIVYLIGKWFEHKHR
jgi:hypothetical protein